MDLQPHLVGELIELRPLRPEDWTELFGVASDPLIWEQHPASDRYREDVFREFFNSGLQCGGAFVAIDRSTGAIIGSSRYYEYDPAAKSVEIGWTFLARAYWGGKYNREMKRLMLDHAFRSVKRVIFLVGSTNVRSQRAVERIGAARAGSRIATLNDQVIEHYVYEILKPAHTMRIIGLSEIRPLLVDSEIIALMRDALIAQHRGECETPMPMHLDIESARAEIHMKSSYRKGGRYFALKMASTFPGNLERGLPTGNGMILLASAETGVPVAMLADEGHLTDVRTAAVSAMVTRELGRQDRVLGIIGTGIQARLQARMHAAVLPLERIVIWGRDAERTAACARDLQSIAPTEIAESPSEVAERARLIVTVTASRDPLIFDEDLQPGTHISAVGSDAPGKQELDPAILKRATLLLVDSRPQCEKLGELQHAPDEWGRAREIGAHCLAPVAVAADAITVADFTGLGVEDLFIAEYCYERSL